MDSKIKLLSHNEMLYNNIKQNIDNGERSIFYSEATGLGKSYVFMKLVEEYFTKKRILYIVPKIAIWENLIHYDEFDYLDAEIEMKTFTAFNTYNSEDEMYKNYDVVFVDECHHMLSDIQGLNVAIFLEDMYNNGKHTFGLTATPKFGDTYVDDMYFKVSCYGYDVFEAIKYGLFPKIDVAVADIDFNEIPKDLQVKFSVLGTKSILEQIIEERSDITHWLAYFGRQSDLEQSESELRKLFPDFEFVKLYQGIGDAEDVIKYFEEYNGKIILMSVSMLLEGMHLSNVGGVLLYRNVGRTNTYFQIYGRLCKVGRGKSPLLLDITNSILQLNDFNIFKSPRHRISGIHYSRRDLFDVTSKTYRYIELRDEMNPFKLKEYRDVRWTSLASLSKALHKFAGSASGWMKNKQGRTAEDYIDFILCDSTYEEYVKNNYVGMYKITILGVEYQYISMSDLSRQIGRKADNDAMRKDNIDSYIALLEFENKHGFIIGGEYKGIDITSLNTVAKELSLHYMTFKSMITIEDNDVKYWIDIYLNNKMYKGINIIYGITELSSYTKKKSTTILSMYRKLKSMETLIDFYIPDEREYKGIIIKSTSTYGDIAAQLNIDANALRSYCRRFNRTIENGIDYYSGLAKRERHTFLLNDDGSTSVVTENILDEESELIDKMYAEKKSWKEISDAVNSLKCNIDRKIMRTPNACRSHFKKYIVPKKGKDFKPNLVMNKLIEEEIDIIVTMKNDGKKWSEIVDCLNALQYNIDNGIVRTVRNIAWSYNDRMKRNGHM